MHRFPVSFARPSRRLALGLALLLAVALLWGQWLGQAHRVLHLPGLAPAAAQVQETGHDHGHDLLGHLLAPGEDAPDCRLYDQLGQGWATALPLLALPALALPRQQAGWASACHQPAANAPFAARAPPALR